MLTAYFPRVLYEFPSKEALTQPDAMEMELDEFAAERDYLAQCRFELGWLGSLDLNKTKGCRRAGGYYVVRCEKI